MKAIALVLLITDLASSAPLGRVPVAAGPLSSVYAARGAAIRCGMSHPKIKRLHGQVYALYMRDRASPPGLGCAVSWVDQQPETMRFLKPTYGNDAIRD